MTSKSTRVIYETGVDFLLKLIRSMQLILGVGSEEVVCAGALEQRSEERTGSWRLPRLFATGTKRVRQFHCPIQTTAARGLRLSDESRHSPHSE